MTLFAGWFTVSSHHVTKDSYSRQLHTVKHHIMYLSLLRHFSSVTIARPLIVQAQQMLDRAWEDLYVVQHLSHTLPQVSNTICFHSQQATEKALKAGCLSIHGLDRSTMALMRRHGLVDSARILEATPYFAPSELTSAVSRLEFLYISTRYSTHCLHCDHSRVWYYTYQQSVMAQTVATDVYRKMERLLVQQQKINNNRQKK